MLVNNALIAKTEWQPSATSKIPCNQDVPKPKTQTNILLFSQIKARRQRACSSQRMRRRWWRCSVYTSRKCIKRHYANPPRSHPLPPQRHHSARQAAHRLVRPHRPCRCAPRHHCARHNRRVHCAAIPLTRSRNGRPQWSPLAMWALKPYPYRTLGRSRSCRMDSSSRRQVMARN